MVSTTPSLRADLIHLLVAAVGKDRLVLDLSCRRREQDRRFYVVTDRWTRFTDFALSEENLAALSQYCAEFLVHGVDVEGKRCGIEEDLVGAPSWRPAVSVLTTNLGTLARGELWDSGMLRGRREESSRPGAGQGARPRPRRLHYWECSRYLWRRRVVRGGGGLEPGPGLGEPANG